jgi:GLPGLI family protein
MKSKIALLILVTTIAYSQKDFQGKVIYEWKTSSEQFETEVLNDPKMDPQMRKFLEAKMNKMLQKTFVLNFDKTTSVYKEEEKLDLLNENVNSSWSPNGIDMIIYKNIQTKMYVINKDLMNRSYNVIDSLPNYNWKLEAETKQIGGYLCNKATTLREVKVEEKNNKLESDKKTNFFSQLEKGNELKITAWYSSEIPVNQGPESYWGLPGLILELNEGRTTILCSKLILNSKEKVNIKLPKGKEISKSEFEKLVVKKNKELEEVDFTNGK